MQGCSTAIVTLGLPYNGSLWRREWPQMIAAVVEAAGDLGIPLTVLENTYAVANVSPIREGSPLAPVSDKGAARYEAWCTMRSAREAGANVVVCRAADFFGPGAENTVLPWSSVLRVMSRRRGVLPWLGDATALRSFAFPADVAMGLVSVDGDPSLRGSVVLNLPAIPAFSGAELVAEINHQCAANIRIGRVSRAVLGTAALLSRRAAEAKEMLYQFEGEHVLDDARYRRLDPAVTRTTFSDVVALARKSAAGSECD